MCHYSREKLRWRRIILEVQRNKLNNRKYFNSKKCCNNKYSNREYSNKEFSNKVVGERLCRLITLNDRMSMKKEKRNMK